VDETRALKALARLRAPLALPSRLFLFAALLSACTSSDPKFSPPAPATNFSEMVKSVSQIRGLPLKQEIILAPAAEAGKAAHPAPSDFSHGSPVAAVERAYQDIGLLPDTSDFKKDLADFHRLEWLIRYDPVKSTVSWPAGAARLGAPLSKRDPDKARDLVPVFAIVQALQEQHFQWRAIIDNVSIEDRRSAFHAVATGDAVLTLIARGMKNDHSKLAPENLDISDPLAAEIDNLAGGLPDFLRRQLTFPYRHGARFVYWALKSKGWSGVNGLYVDPPLSTAQILHPEKYFVEREPPLRFFPAQLLRRFKDGAIVEQTLGEDLMIGLLAGGRSVRAAEEIAAAWRGDQLFAFVDNRTPATVWLSAWRTEQQAQEFLRAYRTALETRHRVRFDSAAANTLALASGRDQRGWLLQRKETVVLLVSAAPANRLTELATEAWRDLEIEQETPEMRFESAQAPSQLSVKSR
jgi:hypothetical protein